MGADTTEPIVILDYSEGSLEVQLHNPSAIADAIGERLLAAFYKCFIGCERLIALEHLLYLNSNASKKPEEHPEADRHSFYRNRRQVVMLLHGAMYEFGDALQGLCTAKVVERLHDRSVWAPLNEIRRQWNVNAYAGMIRNNFAHHFGEIDDYIKGIRDPNAPTITILNILACSHRAGGEYREPSQALLRAHNIEGKSYDEFVAKALDAHTRVPDLLHSLFLEVLESSGIEFQVTERAWVEMERLRHPAGTNNATWDPSAQAR